MEKEVKASDIAGALFLETRLVTDLASLDGGSVAKIFPEFAQVSPLAGYQ